MKKLFMNLVFIFMLCIFVSILFSCSKGPDDKKAINDIKEEIIRHTGYCASGAMKRQINSVSIVGRQNKDDYVIIQASANITNIGRCSSKGTFDYEITL